MSTEIPDEKPIVLFDGVCNRCNGFLQFILPRDTDGKIQFASLQSDIGQELLAAHDLPTDTLESIVLIEGDDCDVMSVLWHGSPRTWAGDLRTRHRSDTFRDQFATVRLTSSPPVAIGGSSSKTRLMSPGDVRSRVLE